MPLDVDNVKGEYVIDPYKAKETYKAWDKTIPGVSAENERVIVQYLEDMRRGINISPKAVKGKRGYRRLLTQKIRLKRICQLLEQHENILDIAPNTPKSWTELEQALSRLFEKLEDGDIISARGKPFRSVADLIKSYKAFWHWYMTSMKRDHNRMVPDITEYLSVKQNDKPRFVYIGELGSVEVEEGFRKLFEHAKYNYRPLIAFMFDSGIRSPTELMNVKRKDITPIKGTTYFNLNIRDETSKTFGRRIKLMLCHETLKNYLQEKAFAPDDFLFPICPRVVNQYLKRLGKKVLGKDGLTMYDFRHNSACYFAPRYKNQNAVMYRFGWKDPKMIHYYTEFLGMRDTLEEDDFLIDVTKTQVEKELDSERKQRIELQDELLAMRSEMAKINTFMNELTKDEGVVEMLARKARERKLGNGLAGFRG